MGRQQTGLPTAREGGEMKPHGVILAGGLGTRLRPVTEVTNKHLLPVYNWPMIFYPINTLKSMGIEEICIILGGNSVGDIVNLLGDGSRFGVNLSYKHQTKPGGIAQALGLSRSVVEQRDVVVILGDNVFIQQPSLPDRFPCLTVTSVDNPKEFGCVEWDGSFIKHVVEKPDNPTSNDIVTGLYFYPNEVFEMIDKLSPSARGELEISDINNMFIDFDIGFGPEEIKPIVVPTDSWYDAGSVDAIFTASQAVRKAYKQKKFESHIGGQVE
jgi:glucose-1-phosphate thymidylyltransferase